MDLYVKFDDSLYLNPATGEIKTQARKSIPFAGPMTVRKMKPSLKYAKKVGDVWIGSNKMSFGLLLAYVQLKHGKSRVIGMFRHGDHYLYIEGSVDMYKHASIMSGFTSDNETPELFMTVRGKVYDAVFGRVDIKNADFDFVGAYRELSRKMTPIQIGALVVCLSISGYLVSFVFEKPPKIEVPKVMQKAPPPPPPLTPAETGKLLAMLKDMFIEKYGAIQDEISSSGNEKWLKNVTLTTAPTPDRQGISANFTYASYYPFDGAKKEGNIYVWTLPYGESLSRQNLAEFTQSRVTPYVCLKYLINNYTVTERSANKWTISLKESKYPRISFILNLIYDCPCIIKDMAIDGSGGLSGTVIIDATQVM